MRVLHLSRDLPPRTAGGISVATDWLMRGLAAEGWSQAAISFDAWRPKKQAIRSEIVDGVLRVQGRAWDAVREFGAAFEPDLVLVHDAVIADRAPRLGRTAYVVHVDHERLCAVRGIEETASLRAHRAALDTADCVLAPSQAVADRVSGAIRARLGVEPADRSAGGKGVLYVGRFDRAKGTDVALEATDGDLTLVGGLPHNPRAEAKWRDRWPQARFVGWLGPAERDAAMRAAALVLVPSLEETLGLVALEAMRLGVPVLASDVGGLVEVVSDVGGGELLPAGDVAAWRDRIEVLLADPARRKALSDAGFEGAKRWTWAGLRGEWLAALQG